MVFIKNFGLYLGFQDNFTEKSYIIQILKVIKSLIKSILKKLNIVWKIVHIGFFISPLQFSLLVLQYKEYIDSYPSKTRF